MPKHRSQWLTQILQTKAKFWGTSLVLSLIGIGGLPIFLSQSASALSSSTYVSTTGSGSVCSSAHPCATIAAGLGAVSSGGTVHVAAGTYFETVAVTKSAKIVGASTSSTIIKPAADLPSEGAVISVAGAGVTVNVSSLTVQGPGTTGCGSIMSGLFVENGAHGDFHDMAVRGIRDEPLSGCQNGRAILVGWGHGSTIPNTTGSASVKNVAISDYQKAGIEVSGSGSNATISNNTITGVGPTDLIAANGIEVTFGASAKVTDNTISGNNYTPAADFATGILLYQPAAGTTVKSNTVSNNEIGLWTNSQDSLNGLNISGISGNGRDAVADPSGWSTPAVTYADSGVSGLANSDGNTVLPYKSKLHVYGYDVFTTIQGALNGVAVNGTVNAANGTYAENLNFTKNGVQLVGQSTAGVVVNNTGANPFGQGVSVSGVTGVAISKMTFNVASGAPISYHFQAYQASGLSLSNLVFNGPGKTGTNASGHGIGGVDINSTSNVIISKVQASNYSKNGFSFTAKFTAADTASSNLNLSSLTSNNNAWAGLAFYTMNGSNTVGSDITGVTLGGTNAFTNNGQAGLFTEGDSDANFGAHNTPAYAVTGLAGAPLELGNAVFSGNTFDIVNYQTANIMALHAKFAGKTGDNMNQTQRGTEAGLLFDGMDVPSLGFVIFFDKPIHLSPQDESKVTNIQLVDWTDVPGAVGYQYESAADGSQKNDDSFVHPIFTSGMLSGSQIATPNTPVGKYHWNVRAVFANNTYGPWTTPWTFTNK